MGFRDSTGPRRLRDNTLQGAVGQFNTGGSETVQYSGLRGTTFQGTQVRHSTWGPGTVQYRWVQVQYSKV